MMGYERTLSILIFHGIQSDKMSHESGVEEFTACGTMLKKQVETLDNSYCQHVPETYLFSEQPQQLHTGLPHLATLPATRGARNP